MQLPNKSALIVFLLAAVPVADAQDRGWNGTYKLGKPYDVGGVRYVPADDRSYADSGVASWYGDKFHGRPTSSGELYDMHGYTAAHRTLPMPSYIRVTNLENGRTVVLRVNDRGPFHSNRIIDVSRQAAEDLGFINKGMARVRVERIFPDQTPEQRRILAALPVPGTNSDGTAVPGWPPIKMPALPAGEIDAQPLPPPSIEVLALANGYDGPQLASYYVQVAAVGDEVQAEVLAQDIGHFGAAFVEPLPGSAGQLVRVRIGPYITRDIAIAMAEELKANGYPDAMVLAPTAETPMRSINTTSAQN